MRQNLLRVLVGVIAVSAVGCFAPGTNSFPSTTTSRRAMDKMKRNAGRHRADMVDNALLRDMAIVDEHFVPHTTELNGTGAARLERMAILLSTYGGTVRYDSRSASPEMIGERVAHIREYLEVSGCDMSRVKVESMITGGYGERAVKLIEVDDLGPRANQDVTVKSSLPLSPGN